LASSSSTSSAARHSFANKRATGRAKDLGDIEGLQSAKKTKGHGKEFSRALRAFVFRRDPRADWKRC
jgi:hypothetical protein